MSPFVAGKDGKRATKKKHNVVESVLVPVASTAILTTAAIHSLTDHRDGGGNGKGSGAGHPARPQPAREPEQPSLPQTLPLQLGVHEPRLTIQALA